VTLAPEATGPEVAPRLAEVAPKARHLQVVPAVGAIHQHEWIVREALHKELGTYERWFECQACGSPYI